MSAGSMAPIPGRHRQRDRRRDRRAGFIPGFSEAARGLKPGETRTIEVTFPAEYGVPNLAGKAASFDITAHKLSRPVVPALDDELAKKLGFEDLAAMREMITRRLQAEYDELARLRLKRQLLDALADVASSRRPRAWWNRNSPRSGSGWRPSGRRAGWMRTTRIRTRRR